VNGVKDSELAPRLLITTFIGRERRVGEDVMNALFFKLKRIEVVPLVRRGIVIVFSEPDCDPWHMLNALRSLHIAGAFWAIPVERYAVARYEYIARECMELVLTKPQHLPVTFIALCRKRGNYIDSCSRLCRFVGQRIESLGVAEVDFRSYEYVLRIEIVDDRAYISMYRRSDEPMLRIS